MEDALNYAFVEDHRDTHHRSGEGAAIELPDGRLLLMFTAFRGESNADNGVADIRQRESSDGGLSWSDAKVVFRPPPESLNIMSPSLLRLTDGRIACTFSVKWTETHCVPQWTESHDEGKTWQPVRPLTSEEGYFVVNNDRLIQLRDGTLVLPYALHEGITRNANDKELLREWLNAWCGIFYSRDGGRSWQRPDTAQRYQKDWFVPPDPLHFEGMPSIEQQAIREKYDVAQEPGIIELKNGRLLMWMRSLSHIFQSTSSGVDAPWSEFSTLAGMNVSCSPQTIKRVPASGDLVMLYNDRGLVPFGSPEFQYRTPLSIAISKDEAATWEKLKPLESDQSRNYCYFALLFFKESFLVAYYESTTARNADGTIKHLEDGSPRRRNLASLKACTGPQRRLISNS